MNDGHLTLDLEDVTPEDVADVERRVAELKADFAVACAEFDRRFPGEPRAQW